MKITLLPHAKRRMGERAISDEEVQAVLEDPDTEYPGDAGRTVAERTPPGRRMAVKVVYDVGLEDERIIVTVELGRPSRRGQEGGDA